MDLPDPGIEPGSPALQADSLPAEPPGKQNRKFISWGSKITEDVDYSHEIKRCLLFGRKAMTKLDSVLKSKTNISLPTMVHRDKAIFFLVVMYGCECWTIKEAEC